MIVAVYLSPFRGFPAFLSLLAYRISITYIFLFCHGFANKTKIQESLLVFCDRLDSIHNGAYHKSLSCVALIRESVSVVSKHARAPHARMIYVSLIIKEINVKSEVVKYSSP